MMRPTTKPPEVGLEVELAAPWAGPEATPDAAAAEAASRWPTTNGESESVVPQTVELALSSTLVTLSQLVPFQCSNQTGLASV